MEEIKFSTVTELFNRLMPALKTKCNDLKRNNILGITEKDIWNYLRYNYWNKQSKLTLGDMVNDILSTPDFELTEYKNKQKGE